MLILEAHLSFANLSHREGFACTPTIEHARGCKTRYPNKARTGERDGESLLNALSPRPEDRVPLPKESVGQRQQ